MNAVKLTDVSKHRNDFSIENINMHIPQGYITGFIGPNGSGKTTIIQMILDIIKPHSGDIQLFGNSYKNHHIKQHIGFVLDELNMYGHFNIKNMKDFIAPFYNTWNEDLFQTYLREFNLPYRKKIKAFSKGMQMKCSLLFAMAHEPELLILDEPATGLDPIFRRELLGLLQEKMLNTDQTVFVASHMTSDLDRIADHVIFMHEGRIMLQEDMESLQDQYHLIKGRKQMIDADTKTLFTGLHMTDAGFSGLFAGDPGIFDVNSDEVVIEKASLEDIMYFMAKQEADNNAPTH